MSSLISFYAILEDQSVQMYTIWSVCLNYRYSDLTSAGSDTVYSVFTVAHIMCFFLIWSLLCNILLSFHSSFIFVIISLGKGEKERDNWIVLCFCFHVVIYFLYLFLTVLWASQSDLPWSIPWDQTSDVHQGSNLIT